MTKKFYSGMPNRKPKRHRITKSGLVDRRAALLEIVRASQPATVRQIFYLASVRGIVAKDDGGYNRVQIDLVDMRRSGQLPYGWIVDHTRWQRKPVTFDSIDEALADTAATYRKALWRDAASYVEIWLEKDALSGVITPVISKFDVPLMVARGYSSETALISSRRRFGKNIFGSTRLFAASPEHFSRKRDHNRAEASLLAVYGASRKLNKEKSNDYRRHTSRRGRIHPRHDRGRRPGNLWHLSAGDHVHRRDDGCTALQDRQHGLRCGAHRQ